VNFPTPHLCEKPQRLWLAALGGFISDIDLGHAHKNAIASGGCSVSSAF
jgi:hypothetical protein